MTEKGFLKSQSVEWSRRNVHFTCVSRREKDHAGFQDRQEKIWQEKCDYLVNHAQECESKKRSEEEAASFKNETLTGSKVVTSGIISLDRTFYVSILKKWITDIFYNAL